MKFTGLSSSHDSGAVKGNGIMKYFYFILLTVFTAGAIMAEGDPSRQLMELDMAGPGAYEKVLQLVDSGANADYYAKGGDRPLFRAVKSGNIDVVKLLLEKGADPNVSFDDATGSPLDSAVLGGDPEMVRLLIAGGAKVNYKMRGAYTALHSACLAKESPSSLEIVAVLLESGAEVNAVTHIGLTPLMNAVEADNTSLVKLLLSRGADPSIKNFQGRTALDIAVKNRKNGEIIRLLKSAKKKGR